MLHQEDVFFAPICLLLIFTTFVWAHRAHMYFTWFLSFPCCLLFCHYLLFQILCQQATTQKKCTVTYRTCSHQEWSFSWSPPPCSPWDSFRAWTAHQRESPARTPVGLKMPTLTATSVCWLGRTAVSLTWIMVPVLTFYLVFLVINSLQWVRKCDSQGPSNFNLYKPNVEQLGGADW